MNILVVLKPLMISLSQNKKVFFSSWIYWWSWSPSASVPGIDHWISWCVLSTWICVVNPGSMKWIVFMLPTIVCPCCMAKTLIMNILHRLFNYILPYLSGLETPLKLPFYTTFNALDVAQGHKVSSKQNLLASFSCTLFNWSGLNLMWRWSLSYWTSWQ